MTLVVVNPLRPEPDIIASAAAILRKGGLVAFPTETVYGLGANALDAGAVARIFEAKGRPPWNPVIAHVANEHDARALATVWPHSATTLARTFWPGPLTMVLPKAHSVPDIVTAGLPAIGIRIPAHPVALALIAAVGTPIAAPSANRFTELSPTTALHVLASLENRVDMILDGGPCDVGIESTVVDLTGDTPLLLRPGIISREALEAALGTAVSMAARESDDDSMPRHSPGRVERHYAPSAAVWLFNANDVPAISSAMSAHAAASMGNSVETSSDAEYTNRSPGERQQVHASTIAALIIDWSLSLPENVHVVRMPRDAQTYARALYATLHDLDEAGFSVVAIERPPDTGGWAGVHDRLTRASR